MPTLLDIDELNQTHRRLVFGEFAREHARLYARYKALYRPRTAEIIELGRQVSDGKWPNCARPRWCSATTWKNKWTRPASTCGIPATLGPAPAGIQATGDPNMNLPWTNAGMPAVTLPAGHAANGLPLGLQLVGQTRKTNCCWPGQSWWRRIFTTCCVLRVN